MQSLKKERHATKLLSPANDDLELAVDRQEADIIGEKLRAAFAHVVEEPIPQQMLDLIERCGRGSEPS